MNQNWSLTKRNNIIRAIAVIMNLSILVSCSRNATLVHTTTTPLPTPPPSLVVSTPVEAVTNRAPTQGGIAEASCNEKPNLVRIGNLYDYYWSNSGNKIYFTEEVQENDWFTYNISTGITTKTGTDELKTLYKLSSEKRLKVKRASGIMDSEWSGIYYTPSTNTAVFIKEHQGEGGDRDLYEDIYVLRDNLSNPEFIGTIKGLVTNVFWTPDEGTAVLAMEEDFARGELSPFHAWIVSIKNKTVRPAFERAQTEKTNVKGVSYDGFWIIYSYKKFDSKLWIRNVIDGEEIEIDLPGSTLYVWPLNKDNLIAIRPGEGDSSDQVVIVDLDNQKVVPVAHVSFRYSRFMEKAVVISPDKKSLIYYSQEEKALFKISLCY